MEAPPTRRRTIGFLALGALIALVGVAIYSSRGGPAVGAGTALPESAADGTGVGGQSGAPGSGGGTTVTARAGDVLLTPKARMIAERLMCVCGCSEILADCTCEETPGSHDMKQYLQQLVDEGRTPAQAREAMAVRYGPAVHPQPASTPAPD